MPPLLLLTFLLSFYPQPIQPTSPPPIQCTTRSFRDLSTCPSSSNQYTMRLSASTSQSPSSNFFQYGKQMSNSFQMAVDHINTYIENVSVSLTLCEDFSNSVNVLSNARESSSVSDFLLGPYSSTLTNVLANYTTTQGMLLATSAAASTSVFANRSLVFGLLPPAREYPTSSLLTWSSLVSSRKSTLEHNKNLTRTPNPGRKSPLELHDRIFRGGFYVYSFHVCFDFSKVIGAGFSNLVFECSERYSFGTYLSFNILCHPHLEYHVHRYALHR